MLEILVVKRAHRTVNLDGLENLVLLEKLTLEGCPVLEKLPSLVALTRLEKLEIMDYPVLLEIHGLTGLEGLHSMVKLESLVLEGSELTEAVPSSLSMFTKLAKLCLCGMSWKQFPDLSNLKN
ncbi:hypothetical protein LINGRAHAP2_LOCUS33329 [Linum grandiflorum]